MNPLDFEKIIKKLDKNKYHISRTLRFTKDNVPYISDWSIFRKDMPSEEYFAGNNEVVLSSAKGNTIDDIKELIRRENNEKK